MPTVSLCRPDFVVLPRILKALLGGEWGINDVNRDHAITGEAEGEWVFLPVDSPIGSIDIEVMPEREWDVKLAHLVEHGFSRFVLRAGQCVASIKSLKTRWSADPPPRQVFAAREWSDEWGEVGSCKNIPLANEGEQDDLFRPEMFPCKAKCRPWLRIIAAVFDQRCYCKNGLLTLQYESNSIEIGISKPGTMLNQLRQARDRYDPMIPMDLGEYECVVRTPPRGDFETFRLVLRVMNASIFLWQAMKLVKKR